MWQVNEIQAKNLCAFKDLKYTLLQGYTTLVFGHNMDNDSQQSNGSGKSALIEALAIGLTGEPLRKVKTDEIINDSEESAEIKMTLTNRFTKETVVVSRFLSRKSPQVIAITNNGNEIVQATVSDYNRYVLDILGLSKDDILSNFILSKHKFKSFLLSSDNDKKEIINRFSNGIMVDEAIGAMSADIEPAKTELEKATSEVSKCHGQVIAYEEQIEKMERDNEQIYHDRTQRINDWKNMIATKRADIRRYEEDIQNSQKLLKQFDIVDEKCGKIEDSDKNLEDTYRAVIGLFSEYGLPAISNYTDTISKLKKELEQNNASLERKQQEIEQFSNEISSVINSDKQLQSEYESFKKTYKPKCDEVEIKINDLLSKVNTLNNDKTRLYKEKSEVEAIIASLNNKLAGVITCPKCKHEFTLAGNIDIDGVREELTNREHQRIDIDQDIADTDIIMKETTEQGRTAREEQKNLFSSNTEWLTKIQESQDKVNFANKKIQSIKNQFDIIKDEISTINKKIEHLRIDMFDEAFSIIDKMISTQNSLVSKNQIAIETANGSIKSYEESIKHAQNASNDDNIASLKASKAKHEEEYNVALNKQSDFQKRYDELKKQESVFIEFKTYLANSKIGALNKITNDFLEKIGSDIRIAMSGFTVLKTGKVREKISISLIRDGVDCGSFDKFSEGEKCRVNLANILAMRKLTNDSCEDGKGLDLLVLDEILDATDESGLNNIFNSLNTLQITSLVVSHGNIAENYPHKLIVNKQNGISYI